MGVVTISRSSTREFPNGRNGGSNRWKIVREAFNAALAWWANADEDDEHE